ncbi:nucleoside hydrolase [Pseudarthrobacter sp. NS4]|uniref:nucleoside hydrolase n=1 Tax=Pseudarthrobacter sp. NS4 TaxID=2973976 RepID=UPI0021628353|nr:nucleoside hydrolase [Pseudarthrobacter sp. NS4]
MTMISVEPRCRVILDNDWAGDPDGLLGLAHHALSPANEIVAITSSLTNPMFGPPEGMARVGADLAEDLLLVLKRPELASVRSGADTPFSGKPRETAAARAIIEAAGSAGDVPLILVCAGPLTNVADALLLQPEIAGSITLAWVGGSAAGEDEDEYNYYTDPAAARFVLANQQLPVWQFPSETYRKVIISVGELDYSLRDAGAGGAWLWKRFNSLVVPDFVKFGPLWCLGDSAPLIVTGLEDITCTYDETSVSPYRRIYTHVDTRLIVSDFFARLRMHS